MDCQHCGTDNREGSKFCNECGNPFPLQCHSCGTENRPGSKFCNECGTPFTGQTPTPSPSLEEPPPKAQIPPTNVPDAERRQLTVMFCDLVDSTALSGELDPEVLREVVRTYQSTCSGVIQRYDGHVAQLLGDGLLVYFGYPSAHEDDAQRAIHAGLGIIEAIGTLNSSLELDKGVELSVRVGIHTGLVVVGEMGDTGSQEQLALGETPNIAARLQGLAEPDTVVISDATHRLVQGYFDCDTLGEQALRGVSQPLVTYRALQPSDAQHRLDVVGARGLTPLVGRDAEVNLLTNRWHQTKSDGGQVVLLHAEPGLGKSRLVQALKESLTNESHTRLECRSSPYYQNTALYPVIDLLQRTLQWELEDSEIEQLRKLEQVLSLYQIPLAETVPLFGSLLSLPVPADRYAPLNLTSQHQRQRTLETIVAMLLELAEQQPVLFIVEDLHWADPSTLVLLDLLVDQIPTAPILVLFTCRPEFQSQWMNRSYYTQVTLNRLSHDDIEQMIGRVTEGKSLPVELIEQLVDKTDGVPLYVEEMTKSVLESGLLKEFEGQYELADSLSALTIPSTLQDSLMARLDRLASAKTVAQYAAVIGRQFSYALLHATSEWDAETLQRELGRLVEAELVYQRGVIPDATYYFKHSLVQETAYESLLRVTRQQLHRQIATVLGEQFAGASETQPELLAYHCMRGEIWDKAFEYLIRSGDKARQAYATEEAITFYNQAIEATKRIMPTLDTPLLLPVYEGRGIIWQLVGKYDEAIADFEMMRQIARKSGNQRKEGESLYRLAGSHHMKQSEDHVQLEEQCAQEAMQLSRQTGDHKILAMSHSRLGMVHQVRGNLQEADRQLGLALEISQREGYKDVLAGTSRQLSSQAYWQGHFQRALQFGQEGLNVSRDIHDGATELTGLAFICLAYWSLGNYAQAHLILDEGMTKAKSRRSRFIIGRLTNTLGWFHHDLGDLAHAIEYNQESIELGRASGISNVEVSALINLGFDYLALGQHDQAHSYFSSTYDRVEREAFGAHRWRWKMKLLIGLAQLAFFSGEYDQALCHVEEGLQEAQKTSSRKYVSSGWALRGKIMAKLADSEAAGADLQRALTLAELLQSPSLLYPIVYDLGQWQENAGNEREAALLYGKSKSIIEQMATAVEDKALLSTFLNSALVQEIHDQAARLY